MNSEPIGNSARKGEEPGVKYDVILEVVPHKKQGERKNISDDAFVHGKRVFVVDGMAWSLKKKTRYKKAVVVMCVFSNR
jgi:hypothetical protein